MFMFYVFISGKRMQIVKNCTNVQCKARLKKELTHPSRSSICDDERTTTRVNMQTIARTNRPMTTSYSEFCQSIFIPP